MKGLVFVAASKEVAYFFLPFSLRGGGCDIACVELWVGELGRTEHCVHIARSTADAHPHPIIYDPPSTYYIQYLIYTYIKKPQPANVGSSQSAAAVLYFPSPFLNSTHIHNPTQHTERSAHTLNSSSFRFISLAFSSSRFPFSLSLVTVSAHSLCVRGVTYTHHELIHNRGGVCVHMGVQSARSPWKSIRWRCARRGADRTSSTQNNSKFSWSHHVTSYTSRSSRRSCRLPAVKELGPSGRDISTLFDVGD